MPAAETTTDRPPRRDRLMCGEVRGGNRPVRAPVDLPGVRGVLASRACDGGRGGDVHYLSVCGSGLLSRICLADVAGHGRAVAEVGEAMHGLIRRLVDWPDQRRLLRGLNTNLARRGIDALTTVVAMTYYPPRRKLSVSYAGHPPAWRYDAAGETWSRLRSDPAAAGEGYVNGALAVVPDATFTRITLRVRTGDRILAVTDGVLDTPDPNGTRFGDAGVEAVLRAGRHEPVGQLADTLESALARHRGGREPDHDDVTFLLLEFTDPPPGPALWHVVRNRLLARLNPGRFALRTNP